MNEEMNRFFTYCNEFLNSIKSLEGGKYLDKHKKVLFLNFIDFLSKADGSNDHNKKRFTNFLKNYSNWENGNKVSLPQTIIFLDKINKDCYEDLKINLLDRLNNWENGRPIPLDNDPTKKEILNYIKEKNVKSKLNNITHFHLLWSLRNKLVHETLLPGQHVDLFSYQKPYYHQINEIVQNNPKGGFSLEAGTWELTYPLIFFEKLLDDLLKNLKLYLENNNINPLENYYLGNSWLEK